MKHDFRFSPAAPAISSDTPRLENASVMGLPLVRASSDETIRALLSGPGGPVYFVNAHCVNERARSDAYARALGRATALLPDGIGIELAARMEGARLGDNLNGTDFVPRLLKAAAMRGQSVFLFGGTPGTAEAAARALCRQIPYLRIAGTRDGYEGAADDDAAIAAINRSGADILLVAMGVPKQELWLDRNSASLAPRLQLGVGALFDFLAGNVRRAPVKLRKARMEWAWRLAMEPRRMAKRYLWGNIAFLARAAHHAYTPKDWAGVGKRALDVTLAGGALLSMLPLFLATVAAIKLDSRGPAFFRQVRVGRDGKPFEMLKFRSMHLDAEAQRAALLATSDRSGVCFKSRNDPRITRVGRLLRRYSIDELPQIINVLRGEMSIVGPRPALPSEVAAYPPRALARLAVKPGLTGIWQVSGRADIGFDKMVDMDIAYARSRSTLLDLILIALTFRAVLSGRGAY
ncbi:WecB/TagA/CpsF family glycosyltransferase [Litorisediminicola beolgyonensis]|uniref:WecB/TagA/CpsF family glycosyltransferase n=1 Tax=Litorisediminicola beolgyonensis TaxID=1173614 RepID=A0ABW3ZDF0_9RHOB